MDKITDFRVFKSNKDTNILDLLAQKYGTDKWGKHHYTPVYYELFKDRRESIQKVLEIGPAEGAGLFMFRDFFPNATIYGAEIDKKRVNKLRGLDRIHVYQCDQSSREDVERLIGQIGSAIDIVIDDGSHEPTDQVFTCIEMMPMLTKEVVYIIEDVAYPDLVGESLDNAGFDVEVKRVGDRYDDCLVIVRNMNG